jgi:hypothetical protein
MITVTIPGLGERALVPGVLYRYAVDKNACPVCGGLGTPWNGWFSCEDCEAVALVASGETFLPQASKQQTRWDRVTEAVRSTP